jgi:hypothetical protein
MSKVSVSIFRVYYFTLCLLGSKSPTHYLHSRLFKVTMSRLREISKRNLRNWNMSNQSVQKKTTAASKLKCRCSQPAKHDVKSSQRQCVLPSGKLENIEGLRTRKCCVYLNYGTAFSKSATRFLLHLYKKHDRRKVHAIRRRFCGSSLMTSERGDLCVKKWNVLTCQTPR